jgi:hypothetical protein
MIVEISLERLFGQSISPIDGNLPANFRPRQNFKHKPMTLLIYLRKQYVGE